MAVCGVYVLFAEAGMAVSREFHSLTHETLQADFDEELQSVPNADPRAEFRGNTADPRCEI